MVKINKCDICGTPITVTAPLHNCKPTIDRLVRLIPDYITDPLDTRRQARYLASLLYALNRAHKPEWWPEHSAMITKLVSKHGQHLIIGENND